MYLRRSLVRTGSVGLRCTARKRGSLRGLLKYKRSVLLVLAFTMGGSLYFYTFTTYMQKYLVNTAHMDAKDGELRHDVRAGHLHAAAAGVRRPLGPDRPQEQHAFVQWESRRSRRCRLLGSLGQVSSPLRGVLLLALTALVIASLYVDQRRGEGGAVPGARCAHWAWVSPMRSAPSGRGLPSHRRAPRAQDFAAAVRCLASLPVFTAKSTMRAKAWRQLGKQPILLVPCDGAGRTPRFRQCRD